MPRIDLYGCYLVMDKMCPIDNVTLDRPTDNTWMMMDMILLKELAVLTDAFLINTLITCYLMICVCPCFVLVAL